MSKGFLKSPVGTLEITAESGKITGIGLAREGADGTEVYHKTEDRRAIEEAGRQLTEYFAGSRRVFELDTELQGTDFQKAVWHVLRTIPYGETMSYAQVASLAGRPGAQRAAGSNIGKNPLLIVIPCHRVIRSDGSLGGFAAGIVNKKILQQIENIEFKER